LLLLLLLLQGNAGSGVLQALREQHSHVAAGLCITPGKHVLNELQQRQQQDGQHHTSERH
jgi:hypothetical protein